MFFILFVKKKELVPLLEQQRMSNHRSDAQEMQKVSHNEVLQLGHASRLDHDRSGTRGEATQDRDQQNKEWRHIVVRLGHGRELARVALHEHRWSRRTLVRLSGLESG